MVATIQVLKGDAAGIANYYTDGSAVSYYTEGQAGIWVGGAAPLVPLPHDVTARDLAHLLLGKRPDGEQLIPPPKARKKKKEV